MKKQSLISYIREINQIYHTNQLTNIGQYASMLFYQQAKQDNIDSGKFKLQEHNFKLASIRKSQDIWRRNIQDYAIGYKDNGNIYRTIAQ